MTDETTQSETTDEQDERDERDEEPLPTRVREGIRDAMTLLATAEPDSLGDAASDDLATVGDLLADADVVGLGEATHGTRDFYQLKDRLVRHLVREHGVRAVAVEANLPETMELGEYVLHGVGDPRSALQGMHYEHLQVHSVLALVEWLREFNAGRDSGDKVAVYGFDAVFTHGAVQRLRDHFDTVDPQFLSTIDDDLAAVDDEGVALARSEEEPAAFAAAERIVPQFRSHLDSQREDHVTATSERAYRRARRYVMVVEQATDNARGFFDFDPRTDDVSGDLLGIRERAMADNVAWLWDYTESDTLVLWAHDAHLNRVTYPFPGSDPTTPSMGSYLADRHGTDYFALGFSFGRGSFRALSAAEDDPEAAERSLEAPLPGTIDEVLAGFGEPIAFVDLRTAGDDDRTADWFAKRRRQFQIGGTFDPDAPADHLVEYVYPEAYDGLCFVAETSQIRPLTETEFDE